MTGNIKTHPFFKTINWTLLEKRQVEPPFKPKVVCDPTPVGTHSMLSLLPSGVGTPFMALPLLCIIYMLSSSPFSWQTCFPDLSGTFSHSLYSDILTLSLPTQSFNKHWELWVQPAFNTRSLVPAICRGLCFGNHVLPPSIQSIFQ